jgi:hypothetical protein
MNKKQCKDGLDLYKKFLVRMEKVSEFLKVAEVGTAPVNRFFVCVSNFAESGVPERKSVEILLL